MNNFKINTRLVDYSSDDDQCDENETENNCRKSSDENVLQSMQNQSNEEIGKNLNKCDLLPLPSEIKCMYLEGTEVVLEDPEKHGGKIRSFPHERGVWATYVYIEYEAKPEFSEMIQDLKKVAETHGITMNLTDDFHVSLSRTLKLRHHLIHPLVDSLKAHLRPFFRFKIMFQSLEVYENEEKSRTFIGLKVHYGYEHLCKITDRIDACLSEFKLPLFYKNPSFHLSCASCIGNKAEEIELFMAELNSVFQSFTESHPSTRTLWIKNISCKSGNKYFNVSLKS